MTPNDRPRRRPNAPVLQPSTITEIARRYHSCAVALAKSFGLTLTVEFMQTYHPAISTVFIESSKVGVRLPPAVQLPPLGVDAAISMPNGDRDASDTVFEVPAEDLPGDTPAPAVNGTGDPPLPTRIPSGDNWPCAGHEIAKLKPAQLHLVLAKAGFRAHADTTLMPLLAALQVERANRMERGKRRNGEGPQG